MMKWKDLRQLKSLRGKKKPDQKPEDLSTKIKVAFMAKL